MPSENGLLLCDDLVFTSRIVGTAMALGLTIHAAKSAVELEGFLRKAAPRCVILDLNTPGLNIDETVKAIAALLPKPFVVGYGSHVDVATLKAAREAGCDIVWPRSKFVDELASSLPTWFANAEVKS